MSVAQFAERFWTFSVWSFGFLLHIHTFLAIPERSMETFALVRPDAVTLFSCRHFSRRLVPRIQSKFLPYAIDRKPRMWTPELGFIVDRRILGLSNEGLSMVRT